MLRKGRASPLPATRRRQIGCGTSMGRCWRTRMMEKNLANARQQDFVEDVVGRKSAQIVVAGSDDHHHFKVGKDNEPLTSVAHGADIARPPRSLGALIWRIAMIPVITVPAPVVDARCRLERILEPCRRDDLAVARLSAVEQHLPDTREIARAHAEAGGENRLAVAEEPPFGRSNAERVEQDPPRIVGNRRSDTLLDDLSNQGGGAAVVNPALPRNRD